MKKFFRLLAVAIAAVFVMSAAACTASKPQTNKEPHRSDNWTNFSAVDKYNIDKVIKTPNFKLDESVGKDSGAFFPMSCIGDNMVLQRNAVNCLWGEAQFEGPFAVKVANVTCYGEAKDGKFEIYLSPMPAGGPYELRFYTPTGYMRFKNVLIGDVILFTGQSNMEWMMEDTLRLGKQYVYAGNAAIGGKYMPDATADPETYLQYTGTEEIRQSYRDMAASLKESNDMIRLCNPRYGMSTDLVGRNTRPQDDLIGTWRAADASDSSINSSSMFAYLFAKRLQAAAQIPIGVMMCAVGGTNVPAWCPRETVKKYSSDFVYANWETSQSGNAADAIARCYNTLIAPLLKFKFRSAVWYQGEGQSSKYAASLTHLIDAWRTNMDNPNLEFLIVELPRYGNGDTFQTGQNQSTVQAGDVYTGLEGSNYFPCREQQKLVASSVDKCALSVSINTGDYDDIHPSDKRVIAQQACDRYIEVFYGSNELLSGPELVTTTRSGDDVILYFVNVGDGIEVRNGGCNFQISEDGKTYYEVRAAKSGKNSVIVSPEGTTVTKINYVRYGMLNYPRVSRLDMSGQVSLFNSAGYPCDQFVEHISD